LLRLAGVIALDFHILFRRIDVLEGFAEVRVVRPLPLKALAMAALEKQCVKGGAIAQPPGGFFRRSQARAGQVGQAREICDEKSRPHGENTQTFA
jgi:hypothetical protein